MNERKLKKIKERAEEANRILNNAEIGEVNEKAIYIATTMILAEKEMRGRAKKMKTKENER